MGASQRRKGKAGELEVVHMLADHWGVKAERNLDQTREGGCDIPVPPWHIEVKRRARIGNVYEWMEQAYLSCGVNDKPVVFLRGDGKKWLVLMTAEEWLRLAREDIATGSTSKNGTK